MRFQMNFTTSYDDVIRFRDATDLRDFYTVHGCDGLEVMPLPYSTAEAPDVYLPPEACPLIKPELVTGVHCWCTGDWTGPNREKTIAHYRSDLDYAVRMGAEYVVFHVLQPGREDGMQLPVRDDCTDREVIDMAADFINELLDGQEYDLWFLMENLWLPGLTFLHPEDTRALIGQVHYKKKGFMLDTGHYLHTNLDLQTQDEAVEYLHEMLDQQEDMIPYIKGIHLQQSLTGDYVKQWLQTPHKLPEDPAERFRAVYEHIFQIDRHEPFTAAGVPALVKRIDPLYVTYEYITRSREELAEYLERGRLR